MSEYTTIGNFTLKKLNLINYNGDEFDISGLYATLELFEDMLSNTLSAKLLVNDSVGLHEKLPIVGVEKLDISFTTGDDFSDINVLLDVYDAPNRAQLKQGQSIYMMKFMSREGLVNQSTTITRGLSGSAMSVISGILKSELGSTKTLESLSEPTTHITHVPVRQRPFDVVQTILNKVVNPQSVTDADYVLFESVDGYKLESLSSLIIAEPEETYSFGGVTSDLDDGDRFYIIGNYIINQQNSPIKSIVGGLYGATLGVFDPITRTYTEKKYDYTKDDTNSMSNENIPFDSELQSNAIDGKFKFVLAGTKEHALLHRTSKFEQIFNSIRITADLAGNSDLRVGQIIELDFPTNSSNDGDVATGKKERALVGKYMVSAIKHSISPMVGGYRSIVELVRDGLDWKPSTESEFTK